jgi:hypothetical protein
LNLLYLNSEATSRLGVSPKEIKTLSEIITKNNTLSDLSGKLIKLSKTPQHHLSNRNSKQVDKSEFENRRDAVIQLLKELTKILDKDDQ